MQVSIDVVEATIARIRAADKNRIGLVIWQMAKDNCGCSTNSLGFDIYKRKLAQLVGKRGGDKNAKRIRTANPAQQTLKGI